MTQILTSIVKFEIFSLFFIYTIIPEMSDTIVSPISYIPAYGGKFVNGKLVGYGSIINNVDKINQYGYFTNGVLDSTPIASQYIE